MSTEYHQIPSQQGYLPVELLTETDPWLLAATSNLSLDAWGPTKTKAPRSPLFEHAGHDSNGNIENAWKSVSSPVDTNALKISSPFVLSVSANSLPNTPKEFYSSTSKIDAWSLQSPSPSPHMEPTKKKSMKHQQHQQHQQHQMQQLLLSPQMLDDDEDTKAIEDELALQNRYKTELCKSYTETGSCRYGSKCQFAHGKEEVRPILRHPKYKTETCKTFHSTGTCPYGIRCRFIHTRVKEEVFVGSYEEELLVGKATPPPGISAQQWSKSWSPSSHLQQQKKPANKKHGLGKIPLVEAVPDY